MLRLLRFGVGRARLRCVSVGGRRFLALSPKTDAMLERRARQARELGDEDQSFDAGDPEYLQLLGAANERMEEQLSEMMPGFAVMAPFEVDGAFAKELLKRGLNVEDCRHQLRQAYEQCRTMPLIAALPMCEDDFAPSQRQLTHRLHGRAGLGWYASKGRVNGDVCPLDSKMQGGFSTELRSSWSNHAYTALNVLFGDTHCAVGFVDLGVLLRFKVSDKPGPMREPLTFLGVERSAYCVAKTQVLWEMCKNGTEAEIVTQAWFSAGWHASTQTAFKKAAKACVAQCTQAGDAFAWHQSRDVRVLLDHWSSSNGVTLAEGRLKWWSTRQAASSFVGHLCEKADREAMALYYLTGECFVGKLEAQVGSACLFDVPDGTPPTVGTETCFSVAPLKDLSGEGVFTQVFERHLLDHAETLSERARNGTIVVRLVHASVEDYASSIRAAKPATMSWSNVPDYYDPAKFHALARRCSAKAKASAAGGTRHSCYSMNWISQVYGTSALDLKPNGKLALLQQLYRGRSPHLRDADEWQGRLRHPLPEHFLNLATTLLVDRMGPNTWARHFLGADQGAKKLKAEIAHSNVLAVSVAAGAIDLEWRYD
ncbi:hypothetical protein M885DRAFT_611638 [Pelagophyceae sp. CCMP2097]|nr:hypothetical protein M885DRAFT_611638 [Pelagophyceae sp. CCMP2097]